MFSHAIFVLVTFIFYCQSNLVYLFHLFVDTGAMVKMQLPFLRYFWQHHFLFAFWYTRKRNYTSFKH